MAERALDLQTTLSGLHRHRRLLLAASLLGALLGIGSVFLWPPTYVSSSLVLLPSRVADPDQMAELVKTDVRISMSDSVLAPAGRILDPGMSIEDLARHVEVVPETTLVLRIEGHSEDPQRAEEISGAVATADVARMNGSANSLDDMRRALTTAREKELQATLEQVEEQIEATTARQQRVDPRTSEGRAEATALARLTAQKGSLVLEINDLQSQSEAAQPSGGASIIQEPSPPKRAGLVTRSALATTVGALLALALAAGLVAFRVRRDRRLIFRDDIADAVGSPVVASVHTAARDTVASWVALLRDHSPSAVEAWTWRRAMRQLAQAESSAGAGSQRGRDRAAYPSSITVVALSDDLRGLATGPQLAAYAVTAGLRTHVAAAQRHETAAALWAGCSTMGQEGEARPGLTVDISSLATEDVDLTVVLAVLDREEPDLVDVPADSNVLLALSSGSATAEELARIAMAIDDAGQRIHGVVVANPDNLDRTSGRLLQPDRVRQIPLPTRLTGTPSSPSPRDRSSVPRRQG